MLKEKEVIRISGLPFSVSVSEALPPSGRSVLGSVLTLTPSGQAWQRTDKGVAYSHRDNV